MQLRAILFILLVWATKITFSESFSFWSSKSKKEEKKTGKDSSKTVIESSLSSTETPHTVSTPSKQKESSESSKDSAVPDLSFKSKCDIHNHPNGRETPSSLLLSPAASDWLYPSSDEIMKYYKEGKAECEAFIRDPKKLQEYLNYTTAPYYSTTDSIPTTGQRNCRGVKTLYTLTGMIVWPFGPYQSCPTYSQCWFGLLTCGNFQSEEVYNITSKEMRSWLSHTRQKSSSSSFKPQNDSKKSSKNDVTPHFLPKSLTIPSDHDLTWTIRSLLFHIRIIGTEIVSPDLRYFTLPSQPFKPPEDVIIAQYVLTIPDTNYQLEVRHYEFYPSLLYSWSSSDIIEKYHLHDVGIMYLGGNEQRCRAWSSSKCKLSTTCCGCDERSHMLTSPARITVIDGVTNCPNLMASDGSKKRKKIDLSLCSAKNSPMKFKDGSIAPRGFQNAPGRWILSSSNQLTPNCKTNAQHYPSWSISAMLHNTSSSHTSHLHQQPISDEPLHSHRRLLGKSSSSQLSFEYASGNPCIESSLPEEFNERHWFYAPYHCQYHFYTRKDLLQCLTTKQLTHMHFQGDSITHELFTMISRYLGITSITEKDLHLLNEHLEMNQLGFYQPKHHKDILSIEKPILLTEGYSFSWNSKMMTMIEEAPFPNILIMNHALTHRSYYPYEFELLLNQTERKYWLKDRNSSVPSPQYVIFQNGKDLHGKKGNTFYSNTIREDSNILHHMYVNELKFLVLDEFLLSTGKFDNYTEKSDGWHTMGSVRQMEAVVLMNMLCNDWYEGKN